jgi:epoxyqueuosine reductase
VSIKDDIKAEAQSLGISLVGITSPKPPPHLDIYNLWLANGRHGAMAYLASDRARQHRSDPLMILPACRSIITVGIRYPSPVDIPPDPGNLLTGRIAAYAWGEDYHRVLPPRLDKLAENIERINQRPIQQRRYTDTGPILEREFTQRAGLGWIGKNTCLIAPDQGSYFLLAEIFIDLELEPDDPFLPDRCGICRRCIEACPTSCILPDRTLDARRCISYLTIELKGSIPLDMRSLMGDWCFGCDVCQEVCPWNIRFATPESEQAFAPRAGLARPDLRKEIHLSPTLFNQKFKHNPVLRTRRRGYLRNVAIALGNHKDPSAMADLEGVMLSESEPAIRGHVAWAIGQIGGQRARQVLEKARKRELDSFVLGEIETALV